MFPRDLTQYLLRSFWLLAATCMLCSPEAAVAASPAHAAALSKSMAQPPAPSPFDYAWLKGQARSLAEKAYAHPDTPLPKALRNMSWDEYQQLAFDRDKALWKNSQSLFRAELFHLGLYFTTPVAISELRDGKAYPVAYSPALFNSKASRLKGHSLPKDLGFAGFRFQFHTDWTRDVVAFLGASYFRAVGSTLQYGLSARGLAVDTALPRPEEFPRFTHFWLERPRPGSDTATVYALLDSPSISGAYRFTITPGEPLLMTVDAALYPRKTIERLGVAPLTSMFMVGENDRRTGYDWRPEIHDSDGLALHTGRGEWLWRPLANPEQLRFNAYMDENPKGFGLLQRDLNFDHYQDDGVYYDKRPSLWVEPTNDWGKGSVQLVEIPTLDETFDNIVAFWNPAQPVEPGRELLFSYNLYWGNAPLAGPRSGPDPTHKLASELAHVVSTHAGLGGEVGKKRLHYSRRFVVDFQGGRIPLLGKDADVNAMITTTAGRVELTSVRRQHAIGGYRVMFDLVPPEGPNPINLRLYLQTDGMPLTETWIYQWTPPRSDQRSLHNPGHLE